LASLQEPEILDILSLSTDRHGNSRGKQRSGNSRTTHPATPVNYIVFPETKGSGRIAVPKAI